MLAIPFKRTEAFDWSGPLRNYLERNFGDDTLMEHVQSIQKVTTIRETLMNSFESNSSASVDNVESYLRMINQIVPRFSFHEDSWEGTFTWSDAFNPKNKTSRRDIAYERACVMFNLGASLTRVAIAQDRCNGDGAKIACKFFQRAAGVYSHIRDKMVEDHLLEVESVDLRRESLDMIVLIMVAQAQMCVFEKASLSGTRPGALLKLVSKASEFYQNAYDSAVKVSNSSGIDKSWLHHLQFQKFFCSAISHFQYSKQVYEEAQNTAQGYGLEIACLQAALNDCDNAMQLVSKEKLPGGLLQTVSPLSTSISTRLTEAIVDNNSIYMDAIPPRDSFTFPDGAALAKAVPPASDITDVIQIGRYGKSVGCSNDDDIIFTGLIPALMQESEAIFQSKLTDLVESTGKKVESACSNVKLQLGEANLPAAVEADSGSQGVPDSIWHRLSERVITRGGVRSLQAGINSNKRISERLQSILRKLLNDLEAEQHDDDIMRSKWRGDWTPTRSAELSQHMHGDAARFHELVLQAHDSDDVVQTKLNSSQADLEILNLSRSRLSEMFPRDKVEKIDPEVDELRRVLAIELVSLGSKIQSVEHAQAALIDSSADASLSSVAATRPGGIQSISSDSTLRNDLIDSELKKYYTSVKSIEQQISELSPALARTLEKNRLFSNARFRSETARVREEIIVKIDNSIDSFEEIASFVADGEKFYMQLNGRIENLKTTIADYTYVRSIERKELDAELERRLVSRQVNQHPPLPAYPGIRPPPPAYSAVSGFEEVARAYPVQYNNPNETWAANNAENDSIRLMRNTLGNGYSDSQLRDALRASGGNANLAVDRLLSA